MTKTPPVMMPAESAVGDIPSTPTTLSRARIATRPATIINVVAPNSRLPSTRRNTLLTASLDRCGAILALGG